MAQYHPQDQAVLSKFRNDNNGIFAYADAHNFPPANVTQAMLEATAFRVEGWNTMANQIEAGLNSNKTSALTNFRGTAPDWKVYLCLKFRHLDGSFIHYDGSISKPRKVESINLVI